MSEPIPYRLRTDDGDLHGVQWSPGGSATTDSDPGSPPGRTSTARPVVLAVHGITANALAWAPVGRRLAAAGVTVIAPDLRGRGRSRALPGDGLHTHVEDLLAICDTLDAPPVLVGHSMGAFVAALFAATAPGRTAGVVLVDGGLALAAPADLDIDAALTATIGPAMQRLSMTFADDDAYIDFWRDHPAFGALVSGPNTSADAAAYLQHDLIDADGGGRRSSCVIETVRKDGADVLADPATLDAARTAVAAGVPIEFLYATRGILDEPQALYDDERLAAMDVPAQVRRTRLDANHYSITLAGAGADEVASAALRLLDRTAD